MSDPLKNELQSKLQTAIDQLVDHLRTDGNAPPDDGVVVDWLCVVHTASFNGVTGHQIHNYYRLFSDGEMPEYKVMGLLTWALEATKIDAFWSNDEHDA